MRAITISQPYSSMIATGQKWIENRHWPTKYRGMLLIHAGLGTQYLNKSELREYPTGCVIATCKLVACVRKNVIEGNDADPILRDQLVNGSTKIWSQLASHEHAEGPYCWVLENVRHIVSINCKGAQGLWIPGDEIVKAINRS